MKPRKCASFMIKYRYHYTIKMFKEGKVIMESNLVAIIVITVIIPVM